jgi:GH24 family phage-related lysozyme (muramidase)
MCALVATKDVASVTLPYERQFAYMYRASEGNVTVGIGHAITDEKAAGELATRFEACPITLQPMVPVGPPAPGTPVIAAVPEGPRRATDDELARMQSAILYRELLNRDLPLRFVTKAGEVRAAAIKQWGAMPEVEVGAPQPAALEAVTAAYRSVFAQSPNWAVTPLYAPWSLVNTETGVVWIRLKAVEVAKLHADDIDGALKELQQKDLFGPVFATYPEPAQLAIADIFFNTGKPGFKKWHNFIRCVKARHWAEAAQHSRRRAKNTSAEAFEARNAETYRRLMDAEAIERAQSFAGRVEPPRLPALPLP